MKIPMKNAYCRTNHVISLQNYTHPTPKRCDNENHSQIFIAKMPNAIAIFLHIRNLKTASTNHENRGAVTQS